MDNLQLVKSRLSKQEEIIEYLKQNSGYWLENDKWDLTEEFFMGDIVLNYRRINFSTIKEDKIKNEVKYYFLFHFKEKLLTNKTLAMQGRVINKLSRFISKMSIRSFNELNKDQTFNSWRLFLVNNGIKEVETGGRYLYFTNFLIDFIQNFYDDREETEKDIWNSKNIVGAKISASFHPNYLSLNFTSIPQYYRDITKQYFKTIITKRSMSHCTNTLRKLIYFFDYFYSKGYTDGFLENLSRKDIESYLYRVNNDRKSKNPTETSKYVSYIRTFLEYIQMAQYDKAPKKEVLFLIFQDDIPKRESNNDEVKKAKFIPEPILKQLDNNIMDLDRPEYIPIYILLRETGWRGTDILNLRFNNCLEKIWNNKDQQYNYYLCGEITKTGIAQLKIPIRDKVAEMVEQCIEKTKEQSTDDNNPKKYLFNKYEGKLKGNPLRKQTLVSTVQRLIKEKDIQDADGNIYHFKPHSLRHTRAKEYVEQGMGISIIQQILGHTSLQMTVHYATVTENTLYEKWKDTEDLNLFKVNTETQQLEQVDLSSEDGEALIRYEYVKKNLDAVRVPFGVCFKPSKLPCKQQMNHCLTCASFCTTIDNIPEYEDEIDKVKQQIEISDRTGREVWAEKNREYLNLLESTLDKVKEHKIVHKNGKSREELV